LIFGGRSLLFQQNVIPSSKRAELGAKDINHPVRLSYKPYFSAIEHCFLSQQISEQYFQP
jgi:hypothetical protein